MKYMDDLFFFIGIILVVWTTFRINEYIGWYLIAGFCVFLSVTIAKSNRKEE